MQHPVRVAIACATDLLVFGASAPAGAALIRNGSFDAFVPSNGTGGHWATSQVAANGGWRSTTSENSFENFFILNDNGPLESDPSMARRLPG